MGLGKIQNLPPIALVSAGWHGLPQQATTQTFAVNAAGLSVCFVGQIATEDGQSHAIDPSIGSPAIGFRLSGMTFSNASTVVNIGLAALDAANGPPGRPANSGATITFDVSRQLTTGNGGSAALTANGWNNLSFAAGAGVSGSKTIAHGDLVAFVVNMSARGGSDQLSVFRGQGLNFTSISLPYIVSWNGTTSTMQTSIQSVALTFSDGKMGWINGAPLISALNAGPSLTTSSSPAEAGNLFKTPVLMKMRGFALNCQALSPSADFDLCVYSDPLGSPALEASKSVEASNMFTSAAGPCYAPLNSSLILLPTKTYAVTLKPTTATGVVLKSVTLADIAHHKTFPMGDGGYAVQRNSGGGAFATRNASLERFHIGILADAFMNGVAPQYHLGSFY